MPPRLRRARLARRFYLAILTPAAIGGVAAFIGTHALQFFQAKETAKTTFTDNQRLEDDKRVDATLENLEKMANVTSADVQLRIAYIQERMKMQRTDQAQNLLYAKLESLRGSLSEKRELERQEKQRQEDQRIRGALTNLDKMPNATSGDVEQRIGYLQQQLESLQTDQGRNLLSGKLESLRGSRNAKREAERQDEEKRRNDEIAQRSTAEAEAKKKAEEAAKDAASAAARARREAEMFDRPMRQRPH